MLSNQKLEKTLQEIRDVTRAELVLYDAKGRRIASAPEQEVPRDLSRAVSDFLTSEASSQILSGYHFFKVVVDDEPEYVLLVNENSEEAYMVGRLTAIQIRELAKSHRDQLDRSSFMQNILLGNLLVVDIYSKAEKLKIRESEWIAYVIEAKEQKDSALMELVRSIAESKSKDFVTELDEKNIVLIKDIKDFTKESDPEEYARMIVDTLHAEAMVRVRVGYGNKVNRISDIPRSYQEALLSLKVGEIFYAQQDTISYQRLGIGRLIYQLPKSLCEMFIKEVFGDRELQIDEETLQTVDRFFENDLNISETARQLYVHRNTLVYRLERFEKIVGLDVRKFEDAMTFKLAMMVLSHMQSMPSDAE